MRILLINPSSRRKFGGSEKVSSIIHPLGLAYLAAVVRKEGYGVKILDAEALDLTDDEILKAIESYNPSVIGLGVKTPSINMVFGLCSRIKENFPDKIIVLGGPHPTALPNESIENDAVDFVVMGEGEFSFLDLVRELEKKKKNFSKIQSLVFKERRKVIINPRRAPIKDLDSLPYPAYDLLPLDRYKSADSRHEKFVSILTSRGCPGQCLYCNKQVFGSCVVVRSAKSLIEEVEFLIKKYGFKEFHIVDDLFTINKKRVIEFCELLIKKKIKIIWKCGNGVRVGTVDLELLQAMKSAGCYSISYGVESGNQEILNKMKKGQTLEQVEKAVSLTKRVGIECVCFFMFGNIGENEKTMRETIAFAKKLDPDFALFSIMVPYPATEVRRIIEKEGKIFETNWDNYDHVAGKAVFEHGEIKRALVERMYKQAFKEFYFRPKY
ncbi:MAG: radical SAM protein, partial [archaeon]